jgi:hypothetical protein
MMHRRFIRVRVGDLSGETQNGSGMAGADHTIMDHVSSVGALTKNSVRAPPKT